jgi:NodT family efflux transporter outer membrane factor (OMF) lipoprotein
MDVPVAYKETGGPWKTAAPQTIDADHPWWDAYGDSTLSALIVQANAANQNIRVAEAQYREAVAITAAARANFFPTIGLNAGANRAQTNSTGAVKLGTTDALGLAASWEPDIWGAVRRSVEAGNASAQASADDLAGARLSIQTTLAQDYLQVRVIDLQRDLYASTTAAYAKAFELTQHQYAAGTVLRSDVALAESQLKTAQAQAVDLEAQRAQLEHAIAVLTGQAPASFSLARLESRRCRRQPTAESLSSTEALRVQLPVTPAGLPSELLERRPDIAGAERRVQAANANIGVAKAAYYPQIVLSASGGFSAATIASLFNTPSRVWSLGAALAQTVFDGGPAQSAHRPGRGRLRRLGRAIQADRARRLPAGRRQPGHAARARQRIALQAEAVQASQLAERLALSQYRAGTATYLSVVTAQTLSLTNQRTAAQVLGRQLAASVSLIAATGGGGTAGPPQRCRRRCRRNDFRKLMP